VNLRHLNCKVFVDSNLPSNLGNQSLDEMSLNPQTEFLILSNL